MSLQGWEQWLSRLSSQAACVQLLWVLSNTLDPQLHARALDLMVALLHAEQQQPQPQQQHSEQGELFQMVQAF